MNLVKNYRMPSTPLVCHGSVFHARNLSSLPGETNSACRNSRGRLPCICKRLSRSAIILSTPGTCWAMMGSSWNIASCKEISAINRTMIGNLCSISALRTDVLSVRCGEHSDNGTRGRNNSTEIQTARSSHSL